MAIQPWIMKEIQRKAENGIKLDVATPEKQKAYDNYQNFYKNETVKKAQSGTALQNPNAWKNSIYNQYKPTPQTSPSQQPTSKQPDVSIMPVGQPQVVQSPSFEMYNPSKHQSNQNTLNNLASNSFIQTQDNGSQNYHFGNSVFNQEQMNEISYYDDLKSNLLKQRHDMTMEEVGKLRGVSEEFSKTSLAPIQKQYYEIEDYMLKKFGQFGGRGGTGNDHSLYGLDRDSLGMNSTDENGFRIHDTAEEHETQKKLIEGGMSPQQAYEAVRRINPDTVYSPSNLFSNNTPQSSEALEALLTMLGSSLPNQSQSPTAQPQSNTKVNEYQKALAEQIKKYLGTLS